MLDLAERPIESQVSLPAKTLNPMNLLTLVLNADYQPLSTWPLSLIPAKEAITDYYKKTVYVVDTWKDAFGNEAVFRSPSITVPAPKVVVLNEYVCVSSEPKFSRRAILLRDRHSCQFCGKKFPANELTFDHLIPRSAGGKTCWDNIVSACTECNARKANKMPEFSGKKGTRGTGLRPLKMPKRPTNAELLASGLESLPDHIREDFGSYLYWNVELEP
jgi:5-methylcytosine-specific restriction endonuclease McrA